MAALGDQNNKPVANMEQTKLSNNNNNSGTADDAELNESDHDRIGVSKELWLEWLKVISDWSSYKSKQGEHIKELVRQGVPLNLRAQIWKLLADVQHTPQASQEYRQLLKQTSLHEKEINRDLARTYPENDYFKDEAGPGQESLFNVMKAYSLFDPEVGYCQGIPFVVGLLLLHLSEEDSFLLFCKMTHDYRMREIYMPTFAELGFCIYQLECLVQEQLTELHMHFQAQNFDTSMYSSQWFLTLFTRNLPHHLAYRIMDLFLSEGLDMIFKLSVAILQICKADLLKLDLEGLMKYFYKEMPSRIEDDPEYLITQACQIKYQYDSKKMKKLSKDYSTIKQKEQEDAIEKSRLRTENRLLQDRLKMLEIESKELADKLIKGQVCRAQEAEDNFAIKRELSQMRTFDEENRTTIAKLEAQIQEKDKLLSDKTINYSNEAQMLIQALQEELVAVKLREAENHVEIDQLNKKITEQELFIKSLRENVPEDPIAQLQEELSAVKLREAECQSAMIELRSKFDELQNLWFDHLQQVHGISQNPSQPSSLDPNNSSPPSSSGPSTQSMNGNQVNSMGATSANNNNPIQVSQPTSLTSSLTSSSALSKFFNNSVIKRTSGSSSTNSGQIDEKEELNRIKQEIITIKLHEASLLNEVKRLRSREMELETSIKIQENKFKRKEEEFKRIESELVEEKARAFEIKKELNEEQRKLIDLQWQQKEYRMKRNVEDVQHITKIGELKQKISSLEIKLEEINAAKKLAESGIEPKDVNEYQERVADLQCESFRLDASNRKLQDIEKKNSELELESASGTDDENAAK